MKPKELAAVRERYDRASLEYDPFRKLFLMNDAAVASLGDVPTLAVEVERLAAGIQKAIAACETCAGQGVITLDYDGEPDEGNCPDCAPLRRLLR